MRININITAIIAESMDTFDRKLLDLIQDNGRRSYADLGAAVGLSVSAVNERLKKLQNTGVVTGIRAQVAPKAVGYDVCAFVHVLIERPEHDDYFLRHITTCSEVQECHHVTGDYSYLLKLRVRDTGRLEDFIRRDIKSLPGVTRTQTQIALSTTKETLALACADSETAPAAAE